MSQGNFIGGEWSEGRGPEFRSVSPATGAAVWTGREADAAQVDAAVAAARAALSGWHALGLDGRIGVLQAFASQLQASLADLSAAITLETGKPRWEARQEVETMIAKVGNSIEAYRDRCAETASAQAGFTAVKRFRPHGVVGVLGPFNLPGHLPHSHIVPALLAGNTVVYKPSEMTPGVGEATTSIWIEAGLPAGVLGMVQGGRNTGVSLAGHPGLDGLFFTGSVAGGVALSKQAAEHPGRILALELGGNNPLLIWDCDDAGAAALIAAQSAFITAGQRCTCARRLIVPEGEAGRRYLDALRELLPRLRVGYADGNPEPFLGPVISAAAADRMLAAQARLEKDGGKILAPMRRLALHAGAGIDGGNRGGGSGSGVDGSGASAGSALLTPGIVDVTGARERPDEEFFGPLLQIVRVDSFASALEEANRTRYGLAAGLISDGRERWDAFLDGIRAGVVNWNRPTTGASGKLPFGGVGDSGNHRPSAYYAADYCAYPVASMEADKAALPGKLPPGIDP
ncbi:MAG: aldehyde dehydrogenase family protein [Fibrobacteres bacterium]|nr:aldehyde dehydrogenase family protein [Fibrobacterota bacterium]